MSEAARVAFGLNTDEAHPGKPRLQTAGGSETYLEDVFTDDVRSYTTTEVLGQLMHHSDGREAAAAAAAAAATDGGLTDATPPVIADVVPPTPSAADGDGMVGHNQEAVNADGGFNADDDSLPRLDVINSRSSESVRARRHSHGEATPRNALAGSPPPRSLTPPPPDLPFSEPSEADPLDGSIKLSVGTMNMIRETVRRSHGRRRGLANAGRREFDYDRLTKLPPKARGNIRARKWVLRTVGDILSNKITVDRRNESLGQPPETLAAFVYDYHRSKYGIPAIARQKMRDLAVSLAHLRAAVPKVEAFVRLCSSAAEGYDIDALSFYLAMADAVLRAIPGRDANSRSNLALAPYIMHDILAPVVARFNAPSLPTFVGLDSEAARAVNAVPLDATLLRLLEDYVAVSLQRDEVRLQAIYDGARRAGATGLSAADFAALWMAMFHEEDRGGGSGVSGAEASQDGEDAPATEEPRGSTDNTVRVFEDSVGDVNGVMDEATFMSVAKLLHFGRWRPEGLSATQTSARKTADTLRRKFDAARPSLVEGLGLVETRMAGSDAHAHAAALFARIESDLAAAGPDGLIVPQSPDADDAAAADSSGEPGGSGSGSGSRDLMGAWYAFHVLMSSLSVLINSEINRAFGDDVASRLHAGLVSE